MVNIPTAKEHFKNHFIKNGYSNQEDLLEWGIQFAKDHVEAALKEAAENAETYVYQYTDCCSECGYAATYVDRDTILNAYPLNNIK